MTACRYCRCTDIEACIGDDGEPCFWYRPGYCSGCAREHTILLIQTVENFDVAALIDHDLMLGGWPVRVVANDHGMSITDHIGCVVLVADPDGFYLAPHYSVVEVAAFLGVKI